MPQVADRVYETTTTTGTGAVTLAGAITGYQAFSTVFSTGQGVYYTIEAVDGSGTPTGDWEVGIGTFTASGTTLSRDTVTASSNGGALVNFAAGTKRVFADFSALAAQRVFSQVFYLMYGTE